MSNLGNVKSLERKITNSLGHTQIFQEHIRNPYLNKNGYFVVSLSKNNTVTYKFVHIIVAKHFISNPDNKPYVNHKNGNKQNNNIENLEWLTHQENVNHAYKNGLIDRISLHLDKPVIQLSLEGEIMGEYGSISEAARNTGIKGAQIRAAAKGLQNTAGYFQWLFKDRVLHKPTRIKTKKHPTKSSTFDSSEEWKDIAGYEGLYQISNIGRIRSVDRYTKVKNVYGTHEHFFQGSLKRTILNQHGYYKVSLCKNGRSRELLVHVLVAQHFITNSEKKPYVNHKSGIKTDNSILNLEWATCSENIKHAYKAGLIKADKTHTGRSVKQMDANGALIKEFKTLKQASRSINVSATQIRSACNGIQHTSGGFKWEFGNREKLPITNNKRVQQFTKNGAFMNEFESLAQASASVNKTYGAIGRAINGNRECGGYMWKFKERSSV